MDNRLLLLKAIILLFKERSLTGEMGSSHLVDDILNEVKTPKSRNEGSFGKDTIVYLREVIAWLLGLNKDAKVLVSEVLMRVRVGLDGNDYLYDILKESLEDISTEESDKELCRSIRSEFIDHLRQLKIRSIVNTFSRNMNFNTEELDWRTAVSELRAALEPLESINTGGNDHHGLVESFMLSDRKGTQRILTEAKEQQTVGGAIRYGWKGLNRMFGSANGARRGEFIITPALQHQFKSGFSMMTLIHHAKYNVPRTIFPDEKRKPLLYRLSFENDAHLDIMTIYKFLYEAEHGEAIDINQMDEVKASEYLAEWCEAVGWDILIERTDPSDYGYMDLFAKLDDLQSKGYEIHGLWIDYPALMSKKGCVQGPTGSDHRDLIRRIRNYTTRYSITCICPWQLSTEAKAKKREGETNFLAEVVNLGYYDSCRTIDQEVDTEIYLNKELIGNGEWWLNLRLGKRRSFERTPDEDSSVYLPFSPVGTLEEDVLLEKDLSRRKLKTSLGDMNMADLFSGM